MVPRHGAAGRPGGGDLPTIRDACGELGITLVGGHTEITYRAKRLVVVPAGRRQRRTGCSPRPAPGRVTPADEGSVEGTAILAWGGEALQAPVPASMPAGGRVSASPRVGVFRGRGRPCWGVRDARSTEGAYTDATQNGDGAGAGLRLDARAPVSRAPLHRTQPGRSVDRLRRCWWPPTGTGRRPAGSLRRGRDPRRRQLAPGEALARRGARPAAQLPPDGWLLLRARLAHHRQGEPAWPRQFRAGSAPSRGFGHPAMTAT